MLQTADGAIYLPAAHSGQVRRLGTAPADGYYESRVEDFIGHTQWGRVVWRGSGVQLQTRSGQQPEPDATWSDWSTLRESGSIIQSPAARYVQYRVEQRKRCPSQAHRCTACAPILPPQIAALEIQPYRTPAGAQRQRTAAAGRPSSSAARRHAGAQPLSPALAGG